MVTTPLRLVSNTPLPDASDGPVADDSALRDIGVGTAGLAMTPRHGRLGALLLGTGRITPAALHLALAHQAESAAPLGQILRNNGDVSEEALYDALAMQFGTVRISPGDFDPDARMIDMLGAAFCAGKSILPLSRSGAIAMVATAEPDRFHLIRPLLEEKLGRVAMVLATPVDIHAGLCVIRRLHLAARAETRVDARESCRSLSARILVGGGLGLAGGLILAASLAGGPLFSGLTLLALAVLAVNTAFTGTMGALWLLGRRRAARALSVAVDEPAGGEVTVLPGARPVRVSILVPLFREKDIALLLVNRLARLQYPADQLEVILVVEEDDTVTRDMLATCDLPPTMRSISVPAGQVQTKPRALNYALDFCRGSIVGVYDAEDAPDPGQIAAVVRQFQLSPPQVACLQGRLDYYNPRTNWMARCFTIEYATWFRVVLPGLARLGWVVPLGGTTLFFRKSALETLGGWDAHNVTEDADLGVRLARRGFRIDLLDSDTLEEANCRAWPWVRQRSRWLKGYAMTYFVHMRDPVALWRDLGARRFWGMQVLFLGSLLGVFTAPLLWPLWLLWLGLPHPWSPHLGGVPGAAFTTLMIGAGATSWAVWAMGVWARGDRRLLAFVPTLTGYHILASIAILKAAFEIVTRPFFWDKTSHGHLSDVEDASVTGLPRTSDA